MKRRLPVLIYIVGTIILLLSCGPAAHIPQTRDEVPSMTSAELLQLMENDDNILVVDVRGEKTYAREHIKDAISAPESIIKAGQWEPPPGKTIVLY